MKLQDRVGQWHRATYGESKSVLFLLKQKIIEESEELLDTLGVLDVEDQAEECADVYLVLLGIADRLGFDLEREAEKKFEIVQSRDQRTRDEQRGLVPKEGK